MSKDSLREAVGARFARLLRQERERRGFSMNVLATRSGLSHSIISLIERDLRSPSLDTLLRIAEALNLDLGTLITKASKAARRRRRR